MSRTNQPPILAAPPRLQVFAWPRRYAALLLPVLCFAVALALRLYRLGAQSLWLDEGGTWVEITGKGWGTLLRELISPTAAYPLYHLLLKGWVALAGDGEWALRFPSALAGALAVVAVYSAAREVHAGATRGGALLAAALMALSPYALWHSQDAKVYSLLMLVVALLIWAALRVLRTSTQRDWLLFAGLAVVGVLAHRLALLALAALLVGLALAWSRRALALRASLGFAGVLLATLGVVGLSRAIVSNGWQESGHIAAGPTLGLWLSLVSFAVDRGNIGGWLGVPLLVWMLPVLLLALLSLVVALSDAFRGRAQATLLVCAAAVPLLLFAVALALAQVYEARYATVAYPAFVLLLVYPWQRAELARRLAGALICGALLVNGAVLFQPQHGLFSGAPVKEAWRAAITKLAGELHPDDLLIIHPYYTLPLWQYYAPRVTPDPLPQPVVFTDFSQGFCAQQFVGQPDKIRDCFKRNTDAQYLEKAYGAKRALLLIAPDHAATVDRPKTVADLRNEGIRADQNDPYGWLGLRFAIPQKTWPCGGDTFVGLEIMCQSYPDAYGKVGAAAQINPAFPLEAVFGNEIRLRGYSLDLLGGKARPGGSLPVTLYWEAATKPTKQYSMFLHLCKDCDVPPLAHTDGPPLRGYEQAGNTLTWQISDPVHDERALPLPATLAPGRYTLLLGVYPVGQPDEASRLPVESAQSEVQGGTRLVLGQIDVSP